MNFILRFDRNLLKLEHQLAKSPEKDSLFSCEKVSIAECEFSLYFGVAQKIGVIISANTIETPHFLSGIWQGEESVVI